MKKISLGLTAAIVILAIAVSVTATVFVSMNVFNNMIGSLSQRSSMYGILDEVNELAVKNFYGDVKDYETDIGAAEGFLKSVGKGSTVMSKKEFEEYSSLKAGEKQGTGIEALFNTANKCLAVKSVEEGSSAQKNGIKVGMFISKVNSKEVEDINFSQLIKTLKEGTGGNIKVTVREFTPENEEEFKDTDYSLTTGFASPTVQYKKLNSYGYIKISAFYDSSVREFSSALIKAQNEKVTGIIIDLRDTSKGNIDSCAAMIDAIVPLANDGTKAIATSLDLKGNKKKSWSADSQSINLPIAVLINENTSSAGELFAVDIRDFGKGKIIGSQSEGDGLYYEEFALSNGGVAIIPTGVIQPYISQPYNGTGVSPDFKVLQEQIPSDMTKDTQLQRAIKYLTEKK